MLTQIDLGNLLLLGILLAQLIILLRLPANQSSYDKRQRRKKIENLKENYRQQVTKVKNVLRRR